MHATAFVSKQKLLNDKYLASEEIEDDSKYNLSILNFSRAYAIRSYNEYLNLLLHLDIIYFTNHTRGKTMKIFLRSFYFAIRGINECFKSEQNFKFHSLVALIVLICSFLLKIAEFELLFVIIVITSVMSAEIINTAVEKIADFIEPHHNEKIRVIKDMTAGMVLITSIGAALCAAVIFLPKIIKLFV